MSSVVPIVSRANFENTFEETLNGNVVADPSWYALYNAILAIGCRATISADTPDSLKESETKGWEYFSNALSVQTELLHVREGLTSIQVRYRPLKLNKNLIPTT
jgi:hypothetical protein